MTSSRPKGQVKEQKAKQLKTLLFQSNLLQSCFYPNETLSNNIVSSHIKFYKNECQVIMTYTVQVLGYILVIRLVNRQNNKQYILYIQLL